MPSYETGLPMNINMKLLVVLHKFNLTIIKKAQANLADLGIGLTEFAILSHLKEKGRSKVQRLGEIASITSGSITYTVNKLVKGQLVVKEQDEEDKRVFWVSLTDQGHRQMDHLLKEHGAFLDQLFSVLEEGEKQDLIDQMKSIGKRIEG